MLVTCANHLVLGFAVLALLSSFGSGNQYEQKTVWQLKRDVAERERQLVRAQRELAAAHARLALAEGKREQAVADLRNVVACYERDEQWIREHANWFCDPRELMTQTQWDLAKARAWLADIQGDTATLVAAWKKIVGFHEQQVERFRRLEQLVAIRPEERIVVQQELDKARERLAEAEKKLATERANQRERPM